MGNFTLNYSGNAINGWGQRIADLEEESTTLSDQITELSDRETMTFGQRVTISLSQCNTTYISNCNGYYEIWGPFVYVSLGLWFNTAVPAKTMTILINPNTFPTPEPNGTNEPTQGFMPLSENRGTFPYVRYDGSLYISGQSESFGTGNLFVNGFYRRQMT